MEALRKLGLSEYEDKIYSSLLRIGLNDARKISKESGVPPTAVYPNLRSLAKKGLIQSLTGEVGMYEAIEPKLAIKGLIERKKAALNEDASLAMEEAALIQSKKLPEIKTEPIQVTMGFDLSSQAFLQMASNTQKSICVMGWKFRSKNSAIRLLKVLKKLKDANKEVKVITNDPAYKNNEIIGQIKSMGHQVRFKPFENFSITIRDGVETKITLKNPNIGDRISLHIADKDLSASMQEYFISVWKNSSKA